MGSDDKVKKAYLVALSKKVSRTDVKKSISRAHRLGYMDVAYDKKNIFSKHLYYAGYSHERAKQLMNAFKDKDSEIIFSIRGGWGVIQIMDKLDYDIIKDNFKPLVGYSDFTLLLNYIYKYTKKIVYHGPNLLREFPIDDNSLNHLVKVLNKEEIVFDVKGSDIIRSGIAKGVIVGGNIELLIRSLGTKYEIDTRNKILFLEGINKPGYLLYDMLYQLQLAGKFKSIRGIILGKFTNCKKSDSFISDFFAEFKVPVIANQEFGHDIPNYAIPIGGKCQINTKKKIWSVSQED